MPETAVLLIRIGIGVTMVAFGVHQVIKPKAWFGYIPSFAHNIFPTLHEPFMRSHGLINVGLGALFMSGAWIGFISWATLIWWLSILPFAFVHEWQSGMRDVAIIAAIAAVIVLL